MATSPRAFGLGPLETIVVVQFDDSPVIQIEMAVDQTFIKQEGAPSTLEVEVSIAASNIPGLEGLTAKATGPNPIPKPTDGQDPIAYGKKPPAFVKANFNLWSFPVEHLSQVDAGVSEYEIIDRALCHTYTPVGIITFYEDPIFGVRCPYIFNAALGPGKVGDPPGDCSGELCDALANENALQVFGTDPTPPAHPIFVETLNSHIELVNTLTKRDVWTSALFVNVNRVLKSMPPTTTELVVVFNIVASMASEGLLGYTASFGGQGIASDQPVNRSVTVRYNLATKIFTSSVAPL